MVERRPSWRRARAVISSLVPLAADGYQPWRVEEPSCPTGKKRWPTEHAAGVELSRIRARREKRSRGDDLGSIESRLYSCARCGGFHLTSMTLNGAETDTRSTKGRRS